jgi:hypothetical protein
LAPSPGHFGVPNVPDYRFVSAITVQRVPV